MGFQTYALSGNPGDYSGLNTTYTVISSQSTPTSIKLGHGNIYAIIAMASGTASAFVQYFNHGGTTLGVSTPIFELPIPAATATLAQNSAYAQWSGGGIPIPFGSNATTSGIWIAAGAAAGTGAAVSADTVRVVTVWA